MVRVRYPLEDFVHDMTVLVARQPEQQGVFDEGTVYLERLIQDPEAIPEEYRQPSGKGRRPLHGSYLLHRGPGLLVSAVVWGPGDHVDPHDHHTWGIIGVVSNGIQEARFQRLDDHTPEGFARLQRERTVFLKPGEISLLVPETDEIHQMDNFSDRPTVEVHVYGTDLVGLVRCQYDPETGKTRRLVTDKFDNC